MYLSRFRKALILRLLFLIIKIPLLAIKPGIIPTKFMQVYSAVPVAEKTRAKAYFFFSRIL